VTGNGKERHLFLFKDRLIVTKKKKPKKPTDKPKFEYKATIMVRGTYYLTHSDVAVL